MNTYPTNQFILGDTSMFNYMDDIDAQIQKAEAYRQRLNQYKLQNQTPSKLIWDEIDSELSPMSDEQKVRLMQDEEYAELYEELQILVQSEILNLVKARIESTDRGKELLSKQLKVVKRLKGKIITDTNREMELFMKFKEFSKQNPNVTYEEFIKANL